MHDLHYLLSKTTSVAFTINMDKLMLGDDIKHIMVFANKKIILCKSLGKGKKIANAIRRNTVDSFISAYS